MLDELDTIAIDWTDFEEAGRRTRDLVRRLANDKRTLRDLVFAVEDDPELLARCERHELLDYIVIYDALDRGFRIRLHQSTNVHEDRPHDHRFSFSSYIVMGSYTHVWHRVPDTIYDSPDMEAKPWMSKAEPDPRGQFSGDEIEPLLVRTERGGDCYTLYHSVVHTTITTPDTVSIFLRGPTEKDRSLIYDRDTGKYWWRWGAHDESTTRRASKVMGLEGYRRFRDRLIELGVV